MKSMMAFMVTGLFHSSQACLYAQFPCAKVTGDLLIEPFWKAVYRFERMGFKVSSMDFLCCSYSMIHFACHVYVNTLALLIGVRSNF